MKGKGDNPIVGSETIDIYEVENHGYKKNNSLEMDDLRAFATHWTWSGQWSPAHWTTLSSRRTKP